ncbi:hypothetical protein M1P56_32575 [Streptomyces sp. HU2014]|uniref:hypothetical protein n=1 Tax=Streptomyces sp. HU2014 TaxID=2939414 RepID=UPI00200F359A|nr:hypothetical protein [Streptomyces sp. HU2014]UQI48715.1 hypothetical protein M1P56_32575 [Streptomyces sp. HU2014]
MSRRTDDYDRSAHITQDACSYAQQDGSDKEFANLVLGSMLEQARREREADYPPEGHDYPRAGR